MKYHLVFKRQISTDIHSHLFSDNKYMINYRKMTLILRIVNLVLMLLILISVYGTRQAMKETEENMRKMYACDAYAYNWEQAPDYCK